MNDFTYTVRSGGGVLVATGDLDFARTEAMRAAKAMTAKGGATGHVLIDYWTKGAVTDSEHVYDDGLAAPAEPAESAYAAELHERHDRIAAGLVAFRSVSLGYAPVEDTQTANEVLTAARDRVWAQYLAETEKVSA